MYKQNSTNNLTLDLFGKNIYEELTETITYFPRKFKDEDESLPVLAEKTTITRKLFGYPFIKVQSESDNDRIFAKQKVKIS